MKRIVFHLYRMEQCGGVKVLITLGNLLKQRGYDVVFFVADNKTSPSFPSDCKFVFGEPVFDGNKKRLAWLRSVEYDADVAIATFHMTAYSVWLNKSRVKKKIYYMQAYEPDFYSDSFLRLRKLFHIYLASVFSYYLPLYKVANCRGSKKGVPFFLRHKVPEIPPGIEPAIYYPRPRKNEVFTIGHLSRRDNWKGSDEFFKAMKMLIEKGYSIKIVAAYDLWKETYGVPYERVIPKNEIELAEYYSTMDVVVSSVWQKGFGYPPLETMACGSVSIATPMDYGRPFHDHIPIKIKSPESIVKAVEYAMQNPEKTEVIRRNGLKTSEDFHWNRVVDKWIDLIEN